MPEQKNSLEKGLRNFPVFEENPYISSLKVPQKNKVVSISVKGLPLFDLNSGEIENEVAFIGIREKVDKEQFVKIFKSHLQSLFGLSVIGMRLCGYFMSITRISTDTVIFNYDDCMKFTGYKSKSSVQKGLTELLTHEFIARTRAYNIYFLNPSIFFNGDRMIVIKDYIVKGSRTDERITQEEQKKIEGNHEGGKN